MSSGGSFIQNNTHKPAQSFIAVIDDSAMSHQLNRSTDRQCSSIITISYYIVIIIITIDPSTYQSMDDIFGLRITNSAIYLPIYESHSEMFAIYLRCL